MGGDRCRNRVRVWWMACRSNATGSSTPVKFAALEVSVLQLHEKPCVQEIHSIQHPGKGWPTGQRLHRLKTTQVVFHRHTEFR